MGVPFPVVLVMHFGKGVSLAFFYATRVPMVKKVRFLPSPLLLSDWLSRRGRMKNRISYLIVSSIVSKVNLLGVTPSGLHYYPGDTR